MSGLGCRSGLCFSELHSHELPQPLIIEAVLAACGFRNGSACQAVSNEVSGRDWHNMST